MYKRREKKNWKSQRQILVAERTYMQNLNIKMKKRILETYIFSIGFESWTYGKEVIEKKSF